MHFLIIAKDKENSGNIRLENRPAHVEFLKEAGTKIKMAGPVLEKGNMVGSRLILEMDNEKEVNDWLKKDPYSKAGLFQEVIVEEIKIVIWN
jgi:uncharacterized protein YciI